MSITINKLEIENVKRNGRDWNMPTQKSVELGLILDKVA